MEQNNLNEFNTDDEINIFEIASAVWSDKFLIGVIVIIFAIGSVIYSLSLPNVFTSTSLLIPAEEQASTPSMNSQVGGFAQMAGIDLGSSGGQDKATLAIAMLESRDFLKHILTFDGVTESLMAAESYNEQSKTLKFNKNDFNVKTKTWIREPGLYKTVIPSNLEVYEAYRETLSASIDKKTGFISISSTHISPQFAYNFLELVIQEVNSLSRVRDLEESEEALKFLKIQLSETQNVDIGRSINQLIESQLKTQMLANVRPDYLLQILDQPYIPILKSSPQRSLICIFGTLLGFFLGMVIVLSKYFFYEKPKSIHT